ncbi:MAG: hypothetical protein JSU00_30910 [Acidobacteria bacterium]|nr:hypothetical protein [Acidobacteriota bacterium]
MYLVVVHWKPAEADPARRILDEAGYSVDVIAPQGMAGLKRITPDADAVLIDLSRLPTQGCAVAVQLRRSTATRHIPIIFVGGAPEKVAAVRNQLPDAGYIEWSGVPADLERAIRRAPKNPVAPDPMAGYSGNPLWKKLGIKPGSSVALVAAPPGFERQLELPEGARITSSASTAERVLVFVRSTKELLQSGGKTLDTAAAGATVWIAWPKRTSGVATDVSDSAVRAWGIEHGWVDYKVCAIDSTWSGYALARRKTRIPKKSA